MAQTTKSVALHGIVNEKVIKHSLLAIAGCVLVWGTYKAFTLKNMWNNLSMRFRVKVLWKSILNFDGHLKLSVVAILENPTSAHITIQKPAISIYDGNNLLAYSDESETEKVSIKDNSTSEIPYTFSVNMKNTRAFAGASIAKIIEWWNNLNTKDETTLLNINLDIVANITLFGFSKKFTAQYGI